MGNPSKQALLARIDAALKRTDKSKRAASMDAGLGPDVIRDLFRKPKTMPTIDTVEKLAPVLELEPAELAGWKVDPSSHVAEKQRDMKIIGEVAAGVWLEVDGSDLPKYEDEPVPYHTRFPESAQYGLVVRGTSINKIAQPGDILQCVDVGISCLSAQPGDLVIVERRRAQAGQKEVTAKRYGMRENLIELSPESDDPRWRTPLIFDPEDATDDEEIVIIAIVVGVYKPLRR